MVKRGARVDYEGATGHTALLLGAAHGHSDAVRALLVCGAVPDRSNKRAETATVVAARAGAVDCLKCLLDSGAAIEYMAHRVGTPLIEVRGFAGWR
jgi:ankyrin repeat protein